MIAEGGKMARNARWFEFVRGLAEDQQAYLGDIMDKHQQIMAAWANGDYHKNYSLFMQENLELRDLMASTGTLGKKFLEVLEDNDRTAADLEKENLRPREGK